MVRGRPDRSQTRDKGSTTELVTQEVSLPYDIGVCRLPPSRFSGGSSGKFCCNLINTSETEVYVYERGGRL